MQNNVNTIREEFKRKYKAKEFTGDDDSQTIEIIGASFVADEQSIFGNPNQEYIDAELTWYQTMSRDVNDLADIYGKRVAIWDSVADCDGKINSNYGWCIYSYENYHQYTEVLTKLLKEPGTRQATMIYTRPTMHQDATKCGMKDFMCTNAVNYYIRDGQLNAVVQMRSNDIVFGYNNDYAWQNSVMHKLIKDLFANGFSVGRGNIYWNVGSLHMYKRHFKLLEDV